MKTAGAVLVVLGIIALVYGGLSYNRERTVLDLGGIKATATQQHDIPLSPVAAAVAIVGGLLLMVTPRRRLQ